jgi:hypothetical protein
MDARLARLETIAQKLQTQRGGLQQSN